MELEIGMGVKLSYDDLLYICSLEYFDDEYLYLYVRNIDEDDDIGYETDFESDYNVDDIIQLEISQISYNYLALYK